MAKSAMKDWRAKYLALVKAGLQKVPGLKRSYPRLRTIQVNLEEHSTIPYSGTLLEEVEVSSSPDHYSPSSVQGLFVQDKSGFVPTNLVLAGPHGIGKTSTLQKIMLDWASGNLYADKFNFIFYVSCRELNQINSDISITGLLTKTCKLDCSADVVKSIFSDPAKVLFLIDGFDEFKWSLEDDYEDYEDPFQDTHKDTFLRCLFDKEIFSEMSLIITSNTLSLEMMKRHVQRPCSFEVLGFSQNELEQYLHNFFSDKDQAGKVLSFLQEHDILLNFCLVPLTCQFVCTILKAGMQKYLASCKTLTSIYLLYIQSLLKGHGGVQPVSACLKKLCSLANDGILNQKTLFEQEDLQNHGLSISEVALVFPDTSVFQQLVEAPSNFSFTHLSLQEFFAALYYVLGQEAEQKETSGGDSFLPKVCKGKSFHMAQNHPYFRTTVRFLFGLLNNSHLKEFTSGFGCNASLNAKGAVENWLADRPGSRICSATLSFLYEAQDGELCSRLLDTEDLIFEQGFYSGAKENVSTIEMLHCIKTSRKSISLEDFLMRPKDLQLLSPLFHEYSKVSFTRCGFAAESPEKSWLANANSHIQELEFHVCVVTPSFFQDLSSLLSTSQSLTKLVLGHHCLDDIAMKALCSGLQHPGCILRDLILDDCDLTPTSCEELGSALKVNRSLQALDMSLNKLEDAGVRALCEGLKDPGCTLKSLRMDFSELTPACCEYLCSVLKTNRCLTTLYMRDNDLQDAGAKLLCEGLQHPGCPLKELRLHESNITSASCEDFRSVLLTNHTLTTLDLTYNNLQDSGVKILCEGLQDPASTLQELILLHCDLSPSACRDLASVMNVNQSLIKLDLTWNNLKDSGVKDLCEALKNPICSLKELRLHGCDLTTCQDLSSAISANRSLTKLEVSGNKFGDTATKAICEALRSPGCALQDLRVGYCDMTDTCAEEVLSVIKTNTALEVMEVSFGFEDVAPPDDLDALCRKFHFPDCTVEKNETQDGTFIYFKYKKQK